MLTMVDIPKNRAGEPWVLTCNHPLQQLIQELTPKDSGRSVVLRDGTIGKIIAYHPDRIKPFEIKINRGIVHCRSNGLTWHNLPGSTCASDVVRFM